MTVNTAPENFLYFNNGITILCGELKKLPIGGKSRDSGVFDCKGSSVINGAQTVGSIITAIGNSGPPAATARVMVRLISLEDCPPDFGTDVTKATNTQNKIEKRDFAALDKQQARLKSELLLSLHKEYVFRTGDQPPDAGMGCTIDEATVALACAHPDITHCMNVKRAISRLYEHIEKPPYTLIFNSGLTAVKLWRAVEVLRRVDALLKVEHDKREGKGRLIAVHGNRVLLYLVFRALGEAVFNGDNGTAEIANIPQLVTKSLDGLIAEIAKNHSASYAGNIFKNATKCKEIVSAIA
jgi:hypothetical protein